MNTIDQYITIIAIRCSGLDSKTLARFHGLESTIKTHGFLTEGQSKFCINLIEQNKEIIQESIPEIIEALKNPTWSREFRQLDNVKTVEIVSSTKTRYIVITSTYSNSFRKLMTSIDDIITLTTITNGKCYKAQLTEHNLHVIVRKLQPHGFSISDEIMSYYDIINSWDYNTESSQFFFDNIIDKSVIINDIGQESLDDLLIIKDRSLRYQYFVKNDINNKSSTHTTIADVLADRTSPKIWIDNTTVTLSKLISSVIRLKRTPILFIFDKSNIKNVTDDMRVVSNALKENNITDKIGTYFRVTNTADGKIFNEFIRENQYNSWLDKTTNVGMIDVNTLPKFLLASDWAPMVIISIGINLRNKALLYANRCDLIITYSKNEPLIYSKNW